MNPRSFIRTLTQSYAAHLRAVIIGATARLRKYPLLQNVTRSNTYEGGPRALLQYLPAAFAEPRQDDTCATHQNARQCRQIVDALETTGYAVDIGDYRDTTRTVASEYDLLITHNTQLTGMDCHRYEKTLKVYLATGRNHRMHNRDLLRRAERLKVRRGIRLKPAGICPETMPFLSAADVIVGFGDESTMRTWQSDFDVPTFTIDNYGFNDTKPPVSRTPDAAKSFVFFGGTHPLLKGLDLLLEAFSKCPDLTLHVCCSLATDPKLCWHYRRELFNTPNIHYAGFVPVNSSQYHTIMNSCAYVILPSCSEGQPGSVIQCMHSGLMPIVTDVCGIDLQGRGIRLRTDSIDEIMKAVMLASQIDAASVRERTASVRQFALTHFNENIFIERWKAILSELRELKSDRHTS